MTLICAYRCKTCMKTCLRMITTYASDLQLPARLASNRTAVLNTMESTELHEAPNLKYLQPPAISASKQPPVLNTMKSPEFHEATEAMQTFISSYLDNIRDRRVLPQVSPSSLSSLIPNAAPNKPEHWQDIFNDIQRIITAPGVAHIQSTQFHGYFPTGNSSQTILVEMLSAAIGCIGHTWMTSPACAEFEVVMMDWLGKLIGLPECFLGGGIIKGSASEATLISLLLAKERTIKTELAKNPDQDELDIRARLVAYTSDQVYSSVERAGMLATVTMHSVITDDNYSLRGEALQKAINEDKAKGLLPCYIVGSLGATPSFSFDHLEELAQLAKEEDIWMHVDASYAGSALFCEEFRWMCSGVENADSFMFNPHKWLLVNDKSSAIWFKNANHVNTFNVEPLYLQCEAQGQVPEYRCEANALGTCCGGAGHGGKEVGAEEDHWQIPLLRGFHSLKLWFVLRMFGKEGINAHIRHQVSLAKEFEAYVIEDPLYETTAPVTLGIVCFRFKSGNPQNLHNIKLANALNHAGIIQLVPATEKENLYIRFVVCSRYTESSDIKKLWDEIKRQERIITIWDIYNARNKIKSYSQDI